MRCVEPYKRKGRTGWWWRYKDPATGRWTGHRKVGETKDLAVLKVAAIRSRLALVDAGAIDAQQYQMAEGRREPLAKVREQFRRHLEGKRTSAARIAKVLSSIDRIVADCRFATLGDISAGRVEVWLTDRTDAGISAKTRNEDLQAIRQLTRWAVKRNKLASDPLVSIDALNVEADRKRIARSLTSEELSRLFMQVDERNPRRALFYRFAFLAGLRWTEIRALRWEQIDLDRGYITLDAAHTKSRRADVVPLATDLLASLRPVAEESGLIFNATPTRKTFERDLERAGIEIDGVAGKATRRSARRTLGTLLAVQGTDIRKTQRIMRHTDPRLTMKFYTDPYLLDLRSELDRVGQRGAEISGSEDAQRGRNLPRAGAG